MKLQQILQAELDEIIFDHRNQDYGAFQLRRQYPTHLRKALIGSTLFFIVLISLPWLMGYFTPARSQRVVEIILEPTILPLIEKPIAPQEAAAQSRPQAEPGAIHRQTGAALPLRQVADTGPVAEPETPSEPSSSPGGSEGQGQAPDAGSGLPGAEGQGTGPAIGSGTDLPLDAPYKKVDQMPEFPGGEAAMLQWLAREIRYPRKALAERIEGTVIVRFIVDERGEIGGLHILRDIGGGCSEETLRVLGKSPAWKAGRQHGREVKVIMTLPVQFALH